MMSNSGKPGNAKRQNGSGEGGEEIEVGSPGSAKRQLGSLEGVEEAKLKLGPPSAPPATLSHRGWYSRGHLPHCDYPDLLQVITYRLADSLPTSVWNRLDQELQELPPEKEAAERRRRLEAWLDAGHGDCLLRIPEAAALVIDSWRHSDGVRYDLIAWVVMPNHVHVLIRTYEGVALAKIVQSWKSYTGRRILQIADERLQGREHPRQLWMREYWDRYIRDERHYIAAVAYIHENPVKAGLVAVAEDWPWSSAREFGREVDSPGNAER